MVLTHKNILPQHAILIFDWDFINVHSFYRAFINFEIFVELSFILFYFH